MTGIILIVGGSILLLAGIVVLSMSSRQASKQAQRAAADKELDNLMELVIADGVITKNEKETIRKIADERSYNYDSIIDDIENRIKDRDIVAETEVINQYKRTGDDFEKFVVQKFNRKYFTVKEWAGDKYVNGIFAETTQNPDLLFQFTLGNDSQQFAVECKWRKELLNNGIEFAKEDQFNRYKKYEKDKGLPVFIAIGIGGKATEPEQLYIIPLREITSPVISASQLKKHKKNVEKNFFFDPKTGTLN